MTRTFHDEDIILPAITYRHILDMMRHNEPILNSKSALKCFLELLDMNMEDAKDALLRNTLSMLEEIQTERSAAK